MAPRKTTRKKPAARKKARRPAAKKAPSLRPRKQPESLRLTEVTIGMTVNDIFRSRDWYCDVLGFTVAEEWKWEGRVGGYRLVAGRASVMLNQDDFAKGRDRVKGVGSRFYLSTRQDVDTIAARVRAKGYPLDSEPGDRDWGARDFNVTDPDGYKLTIAKWER